MPSNPGWVGQREAPAVGGYGEREVRVFFFFLWLHLCWFSGTGRVSLLKAVVPDR